MKKLFSIFLLFAMVLSFEVFAQTGPWQWQHPSPQGNSLRWVKMWNSTTWYAVGLAGTFMKTTNGGTNWFMNTTIGRPFGTSGQYSNVMDAHFFNQSTGIAVGGGGSISRTTNGGTTFDTIPNPVGNVPLNQVYFLNSNTGYAVGNSGNIVKTTNGGLNWATVVSGVTTTLYDIWTPNDTLIIVGTTSGNIRRSTDGGATWASVSTGASANIQKVEFVNALTGCVTGSAAAFRYTTDGGVTWTSANTGLPTTYAYADIDIVTSLVSPPAKLNEGFENPAFPPTGWTTKNILGPTVTWTYSTVTPHSGTGNAKITYDAAGGEDWLVTPKINGIVATDSLKYWWRNAFTSAFPPDSLIILVSTTDTAVSSFTNVVARINTASVPNTWTQSAYSLSAFAGQNIYIAFKHLNTDGNGGYLDDVTVGPILPPTLTATVYLTGDAYNIYKSTNYGTTWDTVGILADVSLQPWTSNYYASDFSANGDTLLTVGAFGLINRRTSASNKTVFTDLRKPGTNYDVWAQSSTGTVIVVGAPTVTGGKDQILRSTNGGSTYSVVPFSTTSTATFNCIQMLNSTTGYVCGTNSSLYRTTNAGANWDSVIVDAIPGILNFSKVEFVNASTGWLFSKTYVAGSDSATIYKTTNSGTNWVKQFILEIGSAKQVYSAHMLDANTGYLTNYTPKPFITTNGGTNWISQALVDNYTSSFLYDIKMANASTGYCVGGGGRVYKTTNAGTLWDTLSLPTRSYTYYGIEILSPTSFMLFGSSGTSFATSNGGTSWTTINTTGATMYNGYILPDGKAFTVGSLGYVLKNNTSLVGVNDLTNDLVPTTYTLDQNYPNPFNPSTTIKFAMPKAGNVTMKIYDVAGREVMKLINNQFMNAGVQKQLFNASSLASGVYFYSLIIDNNLIGTKKMVLIK